MRRLVAILTALAMLASLALAESAPVLVRNGAVQWTFDAQGSYEPDTVFVRRSDGEMEQTTLAALQECLDGNEVRFNSLYLGAEMAVIARVGSVNGPTNVSGHHVAAYVETESATPDSFSHVLVEAEFQSDVIELNQGDLIVATGRLWNAFGNTFSLYCISGHTTTIEPYDVYAARAAGESGGMDVPGSCVTFGACEQDGDATNGAEPIEWLVLAADGDRSLLISRYVLDAVPYDAGDEHPTWAECSLRTWLNGEFLNAAFTPDEQKHIQLSAVSNAGLAASTELAGAYDGADTQDRIFILSLDEANGRFADELSRICLPTVSAQAKGLSVEEYAPTASSPVGMFEGAPWWLRTPGHEPWQNAYCGMGVSERGTFIDGYAHELSSTKVGVRPVLWYTKAENQREYLPLKRGDKGEAVVQLQERLIELGVLSGSADGDYGGKTEAAVAEMQARLGLEPTGVADAATQAALFE